MRRIISILCVMGLAVAILPTAVAADIKAGYDGYTYMYNVYTDPATGPRIEFSDFFAGQYSRAQLTAAVKGFPSQTIGKTDIFFMPDSHMTAVVYYNDDGNSTIILLVFDSMTTQ
jgi:hypothetical protein